MWNGHVRCCESRVRVFETTSSLFKYLSFEQTVHCFFHRPTAALITVGADTTASCGDTGPTAASLVVVRITNCPWWLYVLQTVPGGCTYYKLSLVVVRITNCPWWLYVLQTVPGGCTYYKMSLVVVRITNSPC